MHSVFCSTPLVIPIYIGLGSWFSEKIEKERRTGTCPGLVDAYLFALWFRLNFC
jgi:hypothetical protein